MGNVPRVCQCTDLECLSPKGSCFIGMVPQPAVLFGGDGTLNGWNWLVNLGNQRQTFEGHTGIPMPSVSPLAPWP